MIIEQPKQKVYNNLNLTWQICNLFYNEGMEKFKEIRNLQQKIKSLKKKRFLSSMFKVIGKYTTLGIMLSIPVVLWLIAAIVPMSSQVMVGMITGSFLLGLLYVKDNAALLKKITNIFNTDSDLNIDFEIESLNAEIKKLREQKVEVDNRLINNVESRLLLIVLIGVISIILITIYYFINNKEIEEIIGKNIKDLLKRKKREQ